MNFFNALNPCNSQFIYSRCKK